MDDQQEIEDLILQIKIELCEKQSALLQRLIDIVSGALSSAELQECLMQIDQIRASIQRKEDALTQLQALSGYFNCTFLNVTYLRRKSF